MKEYTPGDRVYSIVRGWYYHIPGTVRAEAQIQYGNLGPRYIVDLDDGRAIEMPANELATPTQGEVDAYQERVERDAEYERQRLAKVERKRKAREASAAAKAQRRQDEQEQKQAEALAKRQANDDEQRRQHAREYGLKSLQR